MGVLDIFDKNKRRKNAITRSIRRLVQIYAQTESRGKAIVTLREDGCPEAIYGLLMRFTVRTEPSITDQEEKQWVHEILIDFGSRAVDPIKKFLRNQEAVTWPLKVLTSVESPRYCAETINELLVSMTQEYQRDHTKKITLIKTLAELGFDDDEFLQTLTAFLDDMDDDPVVAAIEALRDLDQRGTTRERILAALKEKGPDSARLRNLVFDVFAAREWSVKGYRPTVEEMLVDPYYLTSDGLVRIRGDAEA